MRAPEPAALHLMSQRFILAALNSGQDEIRGQRPDEGPEACHCNLPGCPRLSRGHVYRLLRSRCGLPAANSGVWNGWGAEPGNSRYQSSRTAGLNRAQLKDLKLKWAFGFPGAAATFGQPTSYAGRLFVGSEDGTVYSLDAATGCLWWMFKASATVKTAISIGNGGKTALFRRHQRNCLRFEGCRWLRDLAGASRTTSVRAHHRIAASAGNRLYVPISSGEEGASANPAYPCCTFRGSMIALDTSTGQQVWKGYTITEEAKPTRKNSQGVQYFGPSGAAVWSSPTPDLKAHAIYVATGNNYSDPPTNMSDAVVAFDILTGKSGCGGAN